MIGYITLGSNNVSSTAQFYQALFDVLGAKRIYDYPNFVAWQLEDHSPAFAIISPYNKEDATVGNGTMIALNIPSIGLIKQLHQLAIDLGGTNEGNPSDRKNGLYCAYFRDIDGNKINLYQFKAPHQQNNLWHTNAL